MKNVILIFMLLFTTGNLFSQSVKDTNTKIEEFTSKTGVIVRFEDYNLPKLDHTYGTAKTKIRKLKSGDDIVYFYIISNKGKYGEKAASIAFEDLIELEKALAALKSQSLINNSSGSDYVENKFITDDGFQLGYYVSKGKLSWYMKFDKYGNEGTIFVKNIESIESAFNLAKQKTNELKQL